MTEFPIERKPDVKPQFIMTGFTQTAAIRSYAFELRVDGRRLDYSVAVDLALIPGYGIRIQELPLLCRELLERQDMALVGGVVFTELQMRSHQEKLAIAREAAAQKKKAPRNLAEPQEAPHARATWL